MKLLIRISFALALITMYIGFASVSLAFNYQKIANGSIKSVNLEVYLTTDKAKYPVGEKALIEIIVRNTGTKSVALNFKTSQSYDVFISSLSGGSQIWQWSRGRIFTQAKRTVVIMPGNEIRFSSLWDQKSNKGIQVKQGLYLIDAILFCEPGLPVPQAVIEILGV